MSVLPSANRILRMTLMVAAALTAIACEVGPDFKRPASSVEPHWIEEPSAPAPASRRWPTLNLARAFREQSSACVNA